MRKLIFLPAAVLAAAMLSTAVSAQTTTEAAPQAHGWHHHHHGGELFHALKALNLSDAQKASVKQVFQSSHEQYKTQFQALRSAHQAFEAATPGTAEFQTATANLSQAASAAAAARVQQGAEVRTQVYALLSDAQKAQLVTLQAQHQARIAAWQAAHPQAQ